MPCRVVICIKISPPCTLFAGYPQSKCRKRIIFINDWKNNFERLSSLNYFSKAFSSVITSSSFENLLRSNRVPLGRLGLIVRQCESWLELWRGLSGCALAYMSAYTHHVYTHRVKQDIYFVFNEKKETLHGGKWVFGLARSCLKIEKGGVHYSII